MGTFLGGTAGGAVLAIVYLQLMSGIGGSWDGRHGGWAMLSFVWTRDAGLNGRLMLAKVTWRANFVCAATTGGILI